MTTTDWQRQLLDRTDRRELEVAIVGLGYVGLSLAFRCTESGMRVTGIDNDPQRVESIRSRSTGIEADDKGLEAAWSTGRFEVSDDYRPISTADVVVICVPTPLAGAAPDLSFVLSAADSVARHLRAGILVCLESTTYPGTTEDVLRPRLEAHGLSAGRDFALAFSPERIDPGNPHYGVGDIPRVVGGLTSTCTKLAEAFYSALGIKVVTVARPREAELSKLLENTYRQVNIALINEFAMVANELDIDIWEAIEAAATKPFGYQPFYPGVGIGGHCIAVDPIYLTWRIRELGRTPFRLVELAREIDESMPEYVTRRIEQALFAAGKTIAGAKVFILGVTYKPDFPDLRMSRSLDVFGRLVGAGADVSWHDPFWDELTVEESVYRSTDLESGTHQSDVTVILTPHSTYDFVDVVRRSSLVFDARGVTRGINDSKIVRL